MKKFILTSKYFFKQYMTDILKTYIRKSKTNKKKINKKINDFSFFAEILLISKYFYKKLFISILKNKIRIFLRYSCFSSNLKFSLFFF